MGSGPSSLLNINVPYLENPTCCIIAFPARFKMDEVSVLYAPQDIQSMVRDTIVQTWRKGIDKDYHYDGDKASGFKLNGYPFGHNGGNSSRHSIELARMMSAILEGMLRRGWSPRAGINFVRHTRSDSFLFVKETADHVEPRVSAVDLGSSDQIHLVNLPESLCETVAQLVRDYWPDGLKKKKTMDNLTDHKIITKEYPWRATLIYKNLANARTLLLNVIREMYRLGYVILLSAHPQQSVEEVDTIFFAPAINPQPTQLFLFGPQKHDWMFTISAPPGINDVIKQAIIAAWPEGLYKEEETIGEMQAFKMHGYPWRTTGSTATSARRIMLECFRRLRAIGWGLEASIDTTKDLDDVKCFLMRSCAPANHRFFALKLGGSRSVRLIDAPSEVESAVKMAAESVWPGGWKEVGEGKFKANKSFRECQGVFCFVVSAIEAIGWKLVSSADLSVKYHADKNSRFPIDLHTLFFEEVKNGE